MPVTPAIAKTSTPDASSGNPIAVFTADAGAGVADSQAVVPVDPATGLPPVGGLPVSVGNFPATQPISAASLPLPAGASTEATLALIKAKTDNLDVLLSTRTKPADSQTVTGTVATTVADGANVNQGANADTAVTGDAAGTLSAKLRGLSKMVSDMWDSVNHRLNVFIQNATLAVTQSGSWVLSAGTNRIGSVRIVDSADADQTSVKGTQTSRFLGTQDAKDAGRVMKVLSAFKFTPATTEGMVTLTPITDGVAGSTGTSFAVTAGKRWRIQCFMVVIEDSTTTSVGVACYLRINASGAAIVTSPMIAAVAAGLVGTQVARCATSNQANFPDGIEISGSMQIGISQQGIATADATVVLMGYEY